MGIPEIKVGQVWAMTGNIQLQYRYVVVAIRKDEEILRAVVQFIKGIPVEFSSLSIRRDRLIRDV